jgi:hypothetical protein
MKVIDASDYWTGLEKLMGRRIADKVCSYTDKWYMKRKKILALRRRK